MAGALIRLDYLFILLAAVLPFATLLRSLQWPASAKQDAIERAKMFTEVC